MKFRISIACQTEDSEDEPSELMVLARDDLAMETLGLTLAESKDLLRELQSYVVERQAAAYLEQQRICTKCGRRYASKSQGRRTVNTVFGPTTVPNPRWFRCPCTPSNQPRTFRPMGQWLTGGSTPELIYMETKWGSLIPYAQVAGLLKDVLPVSPRLHRETVRRHLHMTAGKMEQTLGEEQDRLFTGSEDEWAAQPLPDGPMTVGIDGGMVRARHKAGFFEVIAGKSVVAFRRDEEDDIPSAKRFGFVQTYDAKPRRRLWELMKSQGMQENQAVLFMSDGADTVRNLQTYLHPSSEHILDWFHVTMRLTVMQQQTKALIDEDAAFGAETSRSLESVKHYLWHGNVEMALEGLEQLIFDLDLRRQHSPASAKLYRSVTEFDTYIRNNRDFIPNYGERYRQGDTITTSFVECRWRSKSA